MPCVVFLCDSNKVIVVKSAWCQSNAQAETINFGSRASELVKVFFSPDHSEKPDFGCAVSRSIDEFDDSIKACYYGYVLAHFGKTIALILGRSM